MDEQATTFEEFHDCLQTLEKINVCTLAHGPTLRWVRKMLLGSRRDKRLSIWDIGSGGGDMLRRIRKLKRVGAKKLMLTGVDIHPLAQQSARASTPAAMGIDFRISNIFALPPDEKADFIISSLFTHHLSDADLVRFIQWMEEHAEQGWYINDLHRHPIPYFVIKYSVKLLRLNRLVVHDAPISVARGFTRHEWRELLRRAGVPPGSVTIQWFFPFRYCVARVKR